MKVQCACGAKCEFDLTPEMASSPVKFLCPACGLDASEFVDGLVRQELGQTAAPRGVPMPVPVRLVTPSTAPGSAGIPAGVDAPGNAPPRRPALPGRVAVRLHGPSTPGTEAVAEAPSAPFCLKHPGELAIEKCYVCSKPICPKCMELFGYVCSPLCKAKAGSHGITLPVYQNQKSLVEARQWRKVVSVIWVSGILLAALLGFWFWYAWFGSTPKPVFSVRFDERSYSGRSTICGPKKDQLVFLHGETLARYDMKSKKELWSCNLVDHQEVEADVEKALKQAKEYIDHANAHAWEFVPKMPNREKLTKQLERAAAAALDLHVRGQNIWVAAPGKIVRYDWDTGKPVKELLVKAGYGGLISRGDELVMVDTESGKPLVTRINLATGESSTGDLEGEAAAALAAAASTGGVAFASSQTGGSAMAGLPTGMPGKDADKPIDPTKAAEQASHMSLPERLALPATLSANLNQERALAQVDDPARKAATAEDPNPPSISLIPTKDGFVQFSVKLVEHRAETRDAMKAPPGKPALDGNASAGRSMEIASDMLNEMQRERGGNLVREDASRYRVTLRRPGSDETWTGEVIGPPSLYPLDTVNVLAANKQIIVLDKSNHKLWQSALTYNVEGGLGSLDAETATYGQGPCVERNDTLYVFDAGVLTAFDLKTGNSRWRLPSVGIAGLFFDDKGMMYVNTTTASPESLKYSRQIDFSQKVISVVLKVNSRDGKVLWTAEPGGLVNYVSGKFLFTVQFYQPSEPDEENPYQQETGFETQPYLRIRRIDPKNGRELWEHFQQRAPLDVQFDKDTIRLVFRKEVQVLKFMAF